MLWTYKAASQGTLKRNSTSGIKTQAVMASDETWVYIHRRFSWIFMAAAGFCALGVVDLVAGLVAGFITAGDVHGPVGWSVLGVFILVVLVLDDLIGGGLAADKTARAYNADHMITPDHHFI
ncbi:SdpI family protein [Bifidobacterium aemilianum]|nr:SdpI family protein [Bifidobacterium aemilianum]